MTDCPHGLPCSLFPSGVSLLRLAALDWGKVVRAKGRREPECFYVLSRHLDPDLDMVNG